MKKSIYDYLGWIAVVAVPIAPVFFFAHKIYNVAYAMANSFWLALGVGLVSAIGLEIVGIYAGHTTMEFWRRGDNTRAVISGLIMLAYVGIGVYELWGTVGVVMFIIAPLVYVLLALQEMLKVEDGKEAGAITFEQDVLKDDKGFERELKREKLRMAHALKMKKLELPSAPRQKRDSSKTVSGTDKTDWRTLTDTERLRLVDFTPEEIAERHDLSLKSGQRWRKRAVELSGKMSLNGVSK